MYQREDDDHSMWHCLLGWLPKRRPKKNFNFIFFFLAVTTSVCTALSRQTYQITGYKFDLQKMPKRKKKALRNDIIYSAIA